MSTLSVQTLLQNLPQWTAQCASGAQPALRAIERCRTAALGYHLYACNRKGCGAEKMQYHSCRNRHCPNCGGARQQQWVESRMRELIPCKYYHVVFTLPHSLNSLVMGNRKAMFNLLFQAAHDTLHTFGKDPRYLGAKAGIISVLHTWGQNLSFHPHVHCIVSGGGIDAQGHWQEARKAKYGALYPVQAMEKVYKGRFMRLLRRALAAEALQTDPIADLPALIKKLYAVRWVVFAKQPFGGPQQVIEYLGRYTHKVAISNRRIKQIDADNRVSFDYKDYADGGKTKRMTLEGTEFLRRFAQHILPRGFCKIRSSGLYSNHGRRTRITGLLEQLDVPQHPEPASMPWHIRWMERGGTNPLICTCCKEGQMVLILRTRAPAWGKEVLRE